MSSTTISVSQQEARRLLVQGEHWGSDDKFSDCCIVWTEGGQIYRTIDPRRQSEIDIVKELPKMVGTIIPEEKVYAAWHDSITEIHAPLSSDVFVKMFYGHCLADECDPDYLRAEIDILEKLSKRPHPNIVEYFGCIRDGSFVKGVCLRKYPCTLAEYIRDKVSAEK